MKNLTSKQFLLETLSSVSLSTDKDLQSLLDFIGAKKNIIAFLDTETTRLYGGIRLVSLLLVDRDALSSIFCLNDIFSDTNTANNRNAIFVKVFDIRDTSLMSLYNAIKDCHIVCHNISFDASCFATDLYLDSMPFSSFDDTLVMAKLWLYSKLDKFSLDKVAELVFGYDVYDTVFAHFNNNSKVTKSMLQKSFVSTKTKDGSTIDVTDLQLAYSALDVLVLLPVYCYLMRAKNDDSDIAWNYELDKLFIQYAQTWQQRGIPIKRSALIAEKQVVENDLETKLQEFNKIAPNLNIKSSKQMQELLGTTTDKLTLKNNILQGDKTSSLIYEIRRLYKKQNFLDRYNTKRVKGFFAPLTASGRAMCSGDKTAGTADLKTDNIMQIPRNLKHLIGFEDSSEKYLVYADFSQLELRTACAEQGDKVLYELFVEGKDLHKYAATQIYGIKESEVSKEQRVMAKFSNFCLLYLGSAKMFRAVVTEMGDREPPNQRECERIVRKWRSIYPGIAKWHSKLMLKFQRGMMIGRTLNGRKYKARVYTDLAAIQNQGLGAEVSKLTIHYLYKKEPNIPLINFIHDCFILEANSLDEAKKLAHLLADTMVEAWKQAIKNSLLPNLPMPTTAEVRKTLDESAETFYSYTNKG